MSAPVPDPVLPAHPGIPAPRRLEVLDDAECRRLLATASVGRVAYTEGALPAIQPVSFLVHRSEILIPTRRGSKVAAASRGSVLAFEVDEIDPVDRTGWNVTAIGAARVVTAAAEIAELDTLGARPWAPADQPCYVAIGVTLLRGRRVVAGAARGRATSWGGEPLTAAAG